MSGASASPGKVCVVCQSDVANLPRVKDPQGHYYCNPCYADARKKAEGQRAAPTPAPKRPAVSVRPAAPAPRAKVKLDGVPLAKVVDDDLVTIDDLDGFESSASTGPTCPSCGGPMEPEAILCTGCGFNRTTGARVSTGVGIPPAVKVVKSGRGAAVGSAAGAGLVNLIKQPWFVGVGTCAIVLFLFLAAKANDGFIGPCILAYYAIGFVTGIWVVVIAFQDTIGQGALSLICGPYNIYYCYARQDNSHLKWAYTASLFAAVLCVSLMGSIPQAGFPRSPSGFSSNNNPVMQGSIDTASDDEETTDDASMVDDEPANGDATGASDEKPHSSDDKKPTPKQPPSKPQSKPTDRKGPRNSNGKSP